MNDKPKCVAFFFLDKKIDFFCLNRWRENRWKKIQMHAHLILLLQEVHVKHAICHKRIKMVDQSCCFFPLCHSQINKWLKAICHKSELYQISTTESHVSNLSETRVKQLLEEAEQKKHDQNGQFFYDMTRGSSIWRFFFLTSQFLIYIKMFFFSHSKLFLGLN